MSEMSSQELVQSLREDLLKLSNLTDLKTYNKVVSEVRNQMKKRRGIKTKRGMSYDELYDFWIKLIQKKLSSVGYDHISIPFQLSNMKKDFLGTIEKMDISKTRYVPFLIVFEMNLNIAMNMISNKDKRGISKINYESLSEPQRLQVPYFIYDVQVINCNFIDLKEQVDEIKKDQSRRFLTAGEMVSFLMYQKLITKSNVITFGSCHHSEKLYPAVSLERGRPTLRWCRLTNMNQHNTRRQWAIPHCVSEN